MLCTRAYTAKISASMAVENRSCWAYTAYSGVARFAASSVAANADVTIRRRGFRAAEALPDITSVPLKTPAMRLCGHWVSISSASHVPYVLEVIRTARSDGVWRGRGRKHCCAGSLRERFKRES
jgi:hypothetical protein